ncbi:MAG: hypothetical protein ACYTG6_05540 [Planctomycetota bacterium]|jgi:hypothetical protein
MKHLVLGLVVTALVWTGGGDARASAQSEIDSALAARAPVFLVVTDGNTRGTAKALEIAQAARARTPNAAVVVLNRTDPANRNLVSKYRVLAAPVPLILVLASNGVVAGGARLADATPDVLVALVPTPRKADMLLALQGKRAVFLVFSRRTMPTQGNVFEVCSEAFNQMEQTPRKAQIVTIDMDDEAERRFLAEMKVDPRATEPVIVVFNRKGQKTGVFRSTVTAAQLIETANKDAPCCPGGSC